MAKIRVYLTDQKQVVDALFVYLNVRSFIQSVHDLLVYLVLLGLGLFLVILLANHGLSLCLTYTHYNEQLTKPISLSRVNYLFLNVGY